MKFIFTTFSGIILFLSCNSGDKKFSQIDISETALDPITTFKNHLVNITKEFVLGKFNYKTDSTFTKAGSIYSAKEVYLNTEVYNAFLNMYNAPKADHIDLIILSGTSNFNEQKAIWERYKNL
ncbi:D-alanyl-D-alanine carboxypeptidase family protein [Winogradskyella sp. UBA3174]|uniref:D-alanyl-D-alanine carboxypeptidase family protein n=1 Tax=Winogradskyella sp. UBA3174 TaxID=1947785 RepID=UPI0025F657FB|nr:D-alanyl-D-alanine carboxypeptidase family protein [Winogradskyella sp. UBA3174]|tara:strand:+ start:33648 stop:34016 length:369 start_codon:yes stop_codon:yes gene_type:complete